MPHLGRKEDALREGRRALELAPPQKTHWMAADVLYYYAVMCAWTGERDLAIEQLARSAKIPAGRTYAELRLDPSLGFAARQIHASKKSSIPSRRSKTSPQIIG